MHGRGAKLELLRNTDASMDPFQTWNQSKNMRMELRPSYVSAYARIRKIETTVIWHPFLPVKPHGHFLHFFPKKSLFFVQKKGPRTGRYCSLKQISEGLFSDPEKSMCQTTGKHVDVSTPLFPARKNELFSGRTKKNEERRTFQILHSPK